MTLDTIQPEVMTVGEAAKVLRIGRNAAYALARRYVATDGREGLPVLVLGRTLRVPVNALRAMVDHPLPDHGGWKETSPVDHGDESAGLRP